MKVHPPSNDFVYYAYQGGVKLVPSDKRNAKQRHFSDITSLTSDVCLVSRDMTALFMNEAALIRSGMSSLTDCLGRGIADVAHPKTANYITKHLQHTLRQSSLQIVEYEFLRKDAMVHQCLLFSLPWYQQNNELGGILDLAIVSGRDPMAQSIAKLYQLGLFNTVNHSVDRYESDLGKLSKREMQCMQLLAEGKTSKEIGLVLKLSPRTIDHYLESCMNKLSVSTRYELIRHYSANIVLQSLG